MLFLRHLILLRTKILGYIFSTFYEENKKLGVFISGF